jgi:large subunit ribosomal protein L10
MSKKIKQMEVAALEQTFSGTKNMVFLTSTRVNALQDYAIRKTLRGQKIRLTMVKNSLARMVLAKEKIAVADDVWAGPTVIAYGGESVKELSQAIDRVIKETEKKDPKSKDRIKVKAAVAEGQQVPFATALTMPTRLEAIGEIIGMILGPASTIAAMLTAPGSQVASQIEKLGEAKEGDAGEAAPAPATA